MYKKIIFILITILLVPQFALAQQTPLEEGLNTAAQESGLSTAEEANEGAIDLVHERIGSYINSVLGLLGILLFVLVVYGGVLYMLAGGDDAQVSKAKSFMINAVIGLFLIGLAYAITNYVVYVIATGV